MKNISLLVVLLCSISSCNFLRKVETEKVPSENYAQSYDGTYVNRIDKYNTLWANFTSNKNPDSTGTITIRTLNKNTLLISHSEISSRFHSYLIKGKIKKGEFQFRRRRRLLGIFPLFWSYRCIQLTLKTNKNGETILSEHNYSTGGILIPMASHESTQDKALKKVSEVPVKK